MRAEAMSANAWAIGAAATVTERTHVCMGKLFPVDGWNLEKFAQEQIRALVRQIFSPSLKPLVRQVVFSAVESQSDTAGICRRIAAALAAENPGDVLLAGADDGITQAEAGNDLRIEKTPLRESALRVGRNLWSTQSNWSSGERSTSRLHEYLSEVRREFDYSIVMAPPVGGSNEATAMAQFADGIVLVLSAGRTRRATACRIKKSLDDSQVRLLGVVLSDREFPIPDSIYRRL